MRLLAVLISIVIIGGCTAPAAEDHSQNHSNEPLASRVIVIGVDGMSPDGIQNAHTPVMDELMKSGAFTFHSRAVLPTSSSSNWASMIMGAGPEQHGITSNGWEPDEYILPPVSSFDGNVFPTIFNVLREQKPDAEITAIYDWGGFGRLFERNVLSTDINSEGGAEKTTDDVLSYLDSNTPDLLFIHLDHVDGAGHGHGHGSPEYYKAVELADVLIGKIVDKLKEQGLMDDAVLIISSDHGGIGDGHGGETLDEIEIPFILYGKGVKQGFKIPHEVYQYDNPATVAYVLGLVTPYAWIGRPVKSAIEGNTVPESRTNYADLPAPMIYPKREGKQPAGGLFSENGGELKITSNVENGSIYYTLDGTEPDKNSMKYDGPVLITNSCVVKARVFDTNDQFSKTAIAYFRVLKDLSVDHGINFKYYEGENWSAVPVFDNLQVIKSGVVDEFRIGDIPEREYNFGIVYETYFYAETEGEYKFYIASDDGSKLYVNGNEVVNNDGDHGVQERGGKVNLTQGYSGIRVEYFNAGGGYWLDVFVKGPGLPKQILPPNLLSTSIETL